MGSAKSFNPSGGFSDYEYHQIGETLYIDGFRGKVIAKWDADGNYDFHSGLPGHSGTSDFYAKPGGRSGELVQVKLFSERSQIVDFDWGHNHFAGKGAGKSIFPKGVVHVQTYSKNGSRTGVTRYMNNTEIKKYGHLLKVLNPDVKFRP